ncbi:hypothetical protein DMENIID0001_111630 [Sergentomyia squamirostris]
MGKSGKSKKNSPKSSENTTPRAPPQIVAVDSFLKEPTCITITQAEHGFDYQKEWFLYFCLVLAECGANEWNAGFEVTAASPFDDIVIEFEMNGKRYSYSMQVKHDKYSRQIVTTNHLLDPTSKKDSKDKIQINFNINKYYTEFSSKEYSKDLLRKFMILANHEYQENPCDNSTSDGSCSSTCSPPPSGSLERSTAETDEVFKKLFQKFADKSVCSLVKKKFDVLKFKRIKLNNGKEINKTDFLENFEYIFKLPHLDGIKDINNVIMEDQYQFQTKNFAMVRENLFYHIREQERPGQEVQLDENGLEITKDVTIVYRNIVTVNEFDSIIYKSVLEVDLPCWSADFLDRFPEWLNFEQDSLDKIAKVAKDTKLYFCHGSARLMAYMVYKATLKNHDKVYCICYSKFRKIYHNLHRKALEKFDRKVICFVDEFDPNEDLTAYENAIFVTKCPENSKNALKTQCSIKDLTKEAQEQFLHEKICFQGNPISLEEISCDSEIQTEILQMRFEKEINLFSPLPMSVYNDRNMSEKPKVFIDRYFTKSGENKIKYKEEHVYNPGENTIIMGLAGVGKSTTMLNVAQKIKNQNPKLFVQFVDLKRHCCHLKEMKEKVIDMWNFFVENFIMYSSTDVNSVAVERLIINGYLKTLLPKIVVFLDGLDEVSPEYTEQIKQMVMELKKKKIQILISSQPHLQNEVDGLEFDVTFNLEPYDVKMQRQFLRDYWAENLKLKLNTNEVQQGELDVKTISTYTKKFLKMCYRSKLTDSISSIPLLLNVIADLYLNDCVEFCKKVNAKWPDRILHVDVLKIYEEIFEKLWNRYYIKTGEDQSNALTIASKSRRIEEVREDYMMIASQNLLKFLWNGKPSRQLGVEEIELIERGFVTKNQKGYFIFIYSTFEEFFAACWLMREIFPKDGTINLEKLQYLFQKSSKIKLHRGVKSFTCRLMLKKINSEDFEKRLTKGEDELREEVSKILLEFLPNAWFDREMELLEVTFKLAEKFCSEEDVKKIFKGKGFFEKVPFISAQHLEKAIALHDQYFNEEESTEILTNREKDIFEKCIMKDSNFDLFEKLFEVVTSRRIYPSDEYKEKTHEYFRDYLLKKKIPNWKFVQEMFSWFFENTQKTEDEIFTEVMELLNKPEDDFKKNRYYIGHILVSYYEFRKNSQDFLKTVCNEIKKEKNYYRFLYAVNSISRDDFMEKVMAELQQINSDLICADGNSIIFHAFQTNNSYLLDKVLEFLPNDQIRKQIAEENCQGISLLKQWTKENYLIECFVKHMINKFGEGCIPDLHRPVGKDNHNTAMEDNINFLNMIYERQILLKDNFLGKFVETLWKGCIEWKLNLLHAVAKYANHPEIIDAILVNLDKQVLLTELEKKNENGDTALHIDAKRDKTLFTDGLLQNFPKEQIIKWMNIRNYAGQSVHDIKSNNSHSSN